MLGFRHVRPAVRVGEVQQALRGIGVEPLGALVEVDPARGPVRRVAEPALDVHPPRLAGLRVRADQQHRLVRAHPVGDVGRLADEMEGPVVLAGEPAVAGLALDQDEPVGDLAGDRVAQLDLPVDPGVGLPLMPDEPHLVDLLVDQRDPAVTDLRAGVDLLQRAPLISGQASNCGGNAACHDTSHSLGVRAASPRRTPTSCPAYVQVPTKPGDRAQARRLAAGAASVQLGLAPGAAAACTRMCAPALPGSGVAVIGYRDSGSIEAPRDKTGSPGLPASQHQLLTRTTDRQATKLRSIPCPDWISAG